MAARYLGPGGLGEASLLLVAVSLVLVLGPASVGPITSTAIATRVARGQSASTVLPASIVLTGLVVGPIALVLLFSPGSSHAVIGPAGDRAIRVTGLVVLVLAAAQVLRSGLQGLGRPTVAWAVLAASTALCPAAVLLFGEEITVPAFLAITLVTQGFVPAIGYVVLLRKSVVWNVRRQDVVHVARLAWPLAIWGGSLVFGQWFGRRALASGGELEQVGIFHAASIVQQPFVIVLAALSATFLPALSRERESQRSRSLTRRVFWCAVGVALLANGTLVTIAGPLMAVLYGDAYEQSAQLVPVIALASLFMVLGNVIDQQLIADERVRTGMAAKIAWLGVFLMVLALHDHPTPIDVAVAMVVAEGIHVGLVLAATWRSASITSLDIAVAGLLAVVLIAQSTLTPLALPLMLIGVLGWAVHAHEAVLGRPWTYSVSRTRRN